MAYALPFENPSSIHDPTLSSLLQDADIRTTDTLVRGARVKAVILYLTEETTASRHIVHHEWKAVMLNLASQTSSTPEMTREILQNAFDSPIELTSEQWSYCLSLFPDFFLTYPWKVGPWRDELSWGFIVLENTISRNELPDGVTEWLRDFMEKKEALGVLPPSYKCVFEVFLGDEIVADATSQQTSILNDPASSDRDRSRAAVALSYISRISSWRASIGE